VPDAEHAGRTPGAADVHGRTVETVARFRPAERRGQNTNTESVSTASAGGFESRLSLIVVVSFADLTYFPRRRSRESGESSTCVVLYAEKTKPGGERRTNAGYLMNSDFDIFVYVVKIFKTSFFVAWIFFSGLFFLLLPS